jgi:hypothetical protein
MRSAHTFASPIAEGHASRGHTSLRRLYIFSRTPYLHSLARSMARGTYKRPLLAYVDMNTHLAYERPEAGCPGISLAGRDDDEGPSGRLSSWVFSRLGI